jgi:quercetin dioxygenase-like cupin family protein
MELIDIKDRVEFADEFRPRILKVADGFKVPLICMEPGQEIPPHPSGTGIFFIVSGAGVMTIEGEEVEVSAGNMIFIDAGEARGIKATEKLTAFAVHIG